MRIEQRNYKLLKRVLPGLDEIQEGTHWKLSAPAFMDLVVECNVPRQSGENATTIVISLTHYGEQNGDPMADPDMLLHVVYPHGGTPFVLPIHWQNDYVGRFDLVYPDYPEMNQVRPLLRRNLNSFLNQWLKNLIEQGHTRTIDTVAR